MIDQPACDRTPHRSPRCDQRCMRLPTSLLAAKRRSYYVPHVFNPVGRHQSTPGLPVSQFPARERLRKRQSHLFLAKTGTVPNLLPSRFQEFMPHPSSRLQADVSKASTVGRAGLFDAATLATAARASTPSRCWRFPRCLGTVAVSPRLGCRPQATHRRPRATRPRAGRTTGPYNLRRP